ncbi:MAG: WecB/TagA/CpsF family glycosyltransferase [Kiritimatiellaeota bacterium]|nr:WecB/TagA/CpsF family glycosyltransferase [Kiritimatiellota bacterium]
MVSAILWVGLGAPKQEKWSQACRDRLNVKVIAPVGGVFDFYTGRVKLPPKWVQKLGLIFDASLLLENPKALEPLRYFLRKLSALRFGA